MSEQTCLHELFEARVDTHPEHLAVAFGERCLTYGELEQQANQLGQVLRAHRVTRGAVVGIYLTRSERPLIAMLACLKLGAAYVPIDAQYPLERVRHMMEEAGASLMVTEAELSEQARGSYEGAILVFEELAKEIAEQSPRRWPRAETGVEPEDLCYIIYTSGSTGKPKGVMVEHRNVVGFVDAFNEVCRIEPDDRLYQGFSLGFDGSVEEIWMALSSGAALVVGPQEVSRSGSDVARLIEENRVTFFSTVPTFLAMIEEAMPSVRLLVVSGEQCPQQMVDRWAVEGRRMLNVYGPTEATVNTTAFECHANRPVTIGRPLRGYQAHILDKDLQQMVAGEPGELCIGGVGVTRGYVNRSEATAAAFVENPCAETAVQSPRLYRTGDLVRETDDGELEFLGRIDRQVKIRGYRVELAEVEAVLRDHPDLRAATTQAFERNSRQELASYVVLEDGVDALDRDGLIGWLRDRLPDYMVPSFLELLEDLPTLASGKVDSSRLPPPTTPLTRSNREMVSPRTEVEIQIAEVWQRLLGVEQVSIGEDFFVDLGGHSLVAAQMVSVLRNECELEVAVRDVYQHPTIRELAERVGSPAGTKANSDVAPRLASGEVFETVPLLTRWCCVGLQSLSLLFFFCLGASPVVFSILLFSACAVGTLPWATAIGWVLVMTFAALPVFLTLSILAKWLVIGRYRAGSYPVWGFYYFRWWFVTRMQLLSGSGVFAGTPIMSLYYRLMGAKVGSNCTLDTHHCHIFDLVSIGEDTSIGGETHLLGYRVEDGMLILDRVDIGSRCFVGIHASMGLGARMEDDSLLDDQSVLGDGEVMAAEESRRGSPAQVHEVSVPEPAPQQASRVCRFFFGLAHLIAIYAMTVCLIATAIPTVLLVVYVWMSSGPAWGVAAVFGAAPLAVVTFCLSFALIKALVLRRARPGTYSLYSIFYLRKWFTDRLMTFSRALMLPLYTTLYLPPWFRLLGAKIGARSELSTVWSVAPELLQADDESFFADGCIIGGRRIHRGRMQLATNRVGRRSFIGNSAVLSAGVDVGDGCLIGCVSTPPADGAPDHTEWLGSPPFSLPHRQKVEGFDEAVTYRPTAKLYLQRALIDGLRILIPSIIAIFVAVAFVLFAVWSKAELGVGMTFVLAAPFSIGLAIVTTLLVASIKWMVMGRFQPTIRPLWSAYVWLNEMVNGAYESVMAPAMAPFLGTPFAAFFLRMIGCKVGRRCFIETTLFSEFDLVEIGDHVSLNQGVVIQTHLFEDRIMKASKLEIESDCSVGNMAVILYDTKMEEGSALAPLSLLMKGEILPRRSRWRGIPTDSSHASV